MLRCRTGCACPRGLKLHPVAQFVHHDEDLVVTPVIIQTMVTHRPTCSDIEIVEGDDFARPDAVLGPLKRTRHLLSRFRVLAI